MLFPSLEKEVLEKVIELKKNIVSEAPGFLGEALRDLGHVVSVKSVWS